MLKKYLIMRLVVMLVGNSTIIAGDYPRKPYTGTYYIPIYDESTQIISAKHKYCTVDGRILLTEVYRELAVTGCKVRCTDSKTGQSLVYNRHVFNSLAKQVALYEQGLLDRF